MSWAVAMTARARPSRRGGAPEDPETPDAPVPGLVISRACGVVADKILSLVSSALNYRRDRQTLQATRLACFFKPFF
jgi:hypothetical protein